MNADQTLLTRLRDMWERIDPAPQDLADRVLFALALDDLDFELMRLKAVTEPVGARAVETIRTVTFGSENLTVMITLPTERLGRLDGWVSPAVPLRIELLAADASQTTTADGEGRFSFPTTPRGVAQLRFHHRAPGHADSGRVVITPAIQL